jgi:5-methylcytosine-specific restriction endonuclease McrA
MTRARKHPLNWLSAPGGLLTVLLALLLISGCSGVLSRALSKGFSGAVPEDSFLILAINWVGALALLSAFLFVRRSWRQIVDLKKDLGRIDNDVADVLVPVLRRRLVKESAILIGGFYYWPLWGVAGILILYGGFQVKQEARNKEKAEEFRRKAAVILSPLRSELATKIHEQQNLEAKTRQEIKDLQFERWAWVRLRTEANKAEQERKRREKQELLKAQADAYRGDIRDKSETIKRRLKVTDDCPYCGGPLGSDYHADHIYPVAKGGLSTTKNMVNVCAPCNMKKSDLTLRQFCDRHDLNEQEVGERLRALRKEY